MAESTNEEMLEARAHDAAEAIRELNHRTRDAVAAPQAYEVLGSLIELGDRLPQLLEQLGNGLRRSLDEYEVVDDKRDPAVSIEMARAALDEAAGHARDAARLLEQAQGAISQQGYTSVRQPHRVQERDLGVAPPTSHSSLQERTASQPWREPLEGPRRSQPEPPALPSL